jgi:hypothetical protein
MTPRKAFRLLWLFMRGRVAEVRQELRTNAVNEVRDRVESFTQRVVFGADSDVRIRFDGRPLGDDTESLADTGSVDLAKALVEAVSRPVAPRVFPTEWRALRELAFGLVDAGPLPEGCTEPLAGVHRQVVSVHAVSPAPEDFDAAVDEAGDDEPEVESETMLVRIGRRIASDADTAGLEFLRAVDRLKASLPGKPAESPVDRRHWFAWLGLTAVTMAGLITVILLYTNESIGLRNTVYACAALVLIFLAGSGAILFLYLRKEFQAANKTNRHWAEYETVRLAAEHEAEELIRLTAVNNMYWQWLPLLAKILHVAGRDAVTTPPDATDLETLPRPSALGVASTETNPRLLTRLAAIIGRRIFQAGWISGLYARILAESMGELKFRRGLAVESADPDPDMETAARGELASRVRDGLADSTVIGAIGTIVTAQTSHLELEELFCAVHPAGDDTTSPTEFLGALQDTDGDRAARFNRRLWTDDSGYPVVSTRTRTWLPERLGLADPPEWTTTPAGHHALEPSADHRTVGPVGSDRTADLVPPRAVLGGRAGAGSPASELRDPRPGVVTAVRDPSSDTLTALGFQVPATQSPPDRSTSPRRTPARSAPTHQTRDAPHRTGPPVAASGSASLDLDCARN